MARISDSFYTSNHPAPGRVRYTDRPADPVISCKDQQGQYSLGLPQPKASGNSDRTAVASRCRHSGVTKIEKTIFRMAAPSNSVVKPDNVTGTPGILLFIHDGVWMRRRISRSPTSAPRPCSGLQANRRVRQVHPARARDSYPAGRVLQP